MRYAECVAVTRFSMRKKQLLVALLAGGGASLLSASAFAQTIALNAQAVVLHYNQDGSSSSHPNGSQPTWISHSDCESNVYLNVPLTLTPGTTGGLTLPVQVWAGSSGSDCTQPVNRSSTTSLCWQVANPVAPATSLNIHVNSQDVVQYITTPTGQKPVNFAPGNTTGCDSFSQSGPVAISLYFMFLDSSGNLVGTDATYQISVALIGPAAPSGVTILPGDTFIKADWTPASDANTQGFQVFCDPPPGHEPASTDSGTDAAAGGATIDASTVLVCDGTTEDGGFDDAGNYLGDVTIDAGCHEENQATSPNTSGGNCQSSEIFSGGGTVSSSTDDSGLTETTDDEGGTSTVVTGATAPPANIQQYACGNVGSPTSTEAIVQGLKNGQEYVVGVAAYDVVGNIGPMSIPGCDSPAKGLDFFNLYNQDGGGAGGGFCSVDKSEPVGTSAFAVVALASLISVVRRKKNKSKTSKGA
jgi:hypothetical protein